MSGKRKKDDNFGSCMATMMLIVIAMPLVGLYLVHEGENDNQKLLGMVLMIVGFGIWIVFAFQKCAAGS